ncbi:MAG TPA: hypothetical protein VFE14_18890, partial [Micromonosporaceae bacterium]|nr:hypothetical protein [Micromonosporaceae bacterium]
MRRTLTITGGICAGLGFLAAFGAVALPWATFRVHLDSPLAGVTLDQDGRLSLLDLTRGGWYLAVLLGSCVGFAAAIGGQGWLHRLGGLIGVLFGISGCLLAINLAGSISDAAGNATIAALVPLSTTVKAGVAIPFGVVAPLLLGASAALLGAARTRAPAPAAPTGS